MSDFPENNQAFSADDGRSGAEGASGASGSQERNYEAEAADMGWVPQEAFRGSPSDWVDAKDFVERGEHILPILRANNRRLQQELAILRSEVDSGKRTVKTLQSHYEASEKAAVEAAKEELRAQLREAKISGDVDRELDVQDQISKLNTTPSPADPSPASPAQTLSEDTLAWMRDNPWFSSNSREDLRKTQEILFIAEDLRRENNPKTGRAFMDACLDRYNATHRSPSKVEGGVASGRSAPDRGFASLPADAKAACHADTSRFVGPGKMFKTLPEYEKHWASIYSSET